jgi:acetyl esterase/lipase
MMQSVTDTIEARMMRAAEKTVVPLWSDSEVGIDTNVPEEELEPGKFCNIRNPTLTIYEPSADRANGGAMVICPGGGYGMVSCINEGYAVAEWLSDLGFKAYVLKYRLPATEGVNYRHPIPLRDVQCAIRSVRMDAILERRRCDRVGIIGFSAGGHLAASAMTQYDSPIDDEPVSCRPDFGILVYPVITFRDETLCHTGSRDNLLGPDASPVEWADHSPELNVTADTPACFLAHARDDEGVLFGNSVVMHEALRACGVASELRLYEQGGHGFGMGAPEHDCSQWSADAAEWLTPWR